MPASNAWLGIDGALGAFSVALARGDDRGTAITSRTERTAGTAALEKGLALIERVLGGSSLESLAGIAVVTGPGSFTGLRIALAYAKSLAFAARLPLVAVSSYDACEPPGCAPPYATFVHGRAGVGCVRLRLQSETWERCNSYERLAAELAARVDGADLRLYGAAEGAAAALGERGITVHPQPPYAQTPALAAALRALGGAPRISPHAIDAEYGEAHYAERNTADRFS